VGDGDGKGVGAEAKPKPKAPKVPKAAPKEVKEFLSCKTDSLDLDPAKGDWVPAIPGIGKPDVKIEKGAKEGTATVTLSKGGEYVKLEIKLDVSIKDGHLQVDTTSDLVKAGIDEWVNNFNAWLDEKKRKLKDITVKDGKATITKEALPAGGKQGAMVVPGGVKKAAAAGALAAGVLGGGYLAYDAVTDDGGSSQQVTAEGPAGADGASVCGVLTGFDPLTDPYPECQPGGDPLDYSDCGPPLACVTEFQPAVVGAGVNITHDGSEPDAVTGEEGVSQGEVVGGTTWNDLIRVAAECAGRTTTAEATPDADGLFRAPLPLYQYGTCQITEVSLLDGGQVAVPVPPQSLVPGGSFTVGPEETSVEGEITELLAQLRRLQDLQVTIETRFITVTDTFFEGIGVCFDLAIEGVPCPDANHPIGFSVLGDGRGASGASVAGATDQVLQQYFGDGGRYPCGPGHLAFTACGEDAGVPPAGTFLSLTTIAPEALADVTFTVGEASYTVGLTDTGATLTTEGGDPLGRAMIRGPMVTLLVPGDADTFQVDGSPDLAIDSALSFPAAPDGVPAEPAEPAETVEQFAAELSQSISTGDLQFAIQRLHPAVLEAFPNNQCPPHLEAISEPTFNVEVVSVGATGRYDFAPPSLGGRSFPAEDVTTVVVDLTLRGETSRQEVHYGLIDGLHHWYTDCGATLQGA
jgi:hypothetical protein